MIKTNNVNKDVDIENAKKGLNKNLIFLINQQSEKLLKATKMCQFTKKDFM